jgi:hypothetical protein
VCVCVCVCVYVSLFLSPRERVRSREREREYLRERGRWVDLLRNERNERYPYLTKGNERVEVITNVKLVECTLYTFKFDNTR